MIARTLGIGLLAIGAVLLLGSMAEAHYIQIGGRLIYHSAQCGVDLKGVANPTTQPAKTECELTVSFLDVLCRNNGGELAPGQIPRIIILTGEENVAPGDVTDKKKGIATVNITVVPACGADPAPDDPCLAGVTSADACPNENWDLVAVIVREARMVERAFKCTDETCTTSILASESQRDCVLPAAVNFDTVPPPEGIPYTCTLLSNEHFN
jgi:hypothetical protein